MRAEDVDALLERVQYKPAGAAAASFIVSFTFQGEMYVVAYLEASLDACAAAAAPAPLATPPVVVVGAVYGRTLAVLARGCGRLRFCLLTQAKFARLSCSSWLRSLLSQGRQDPSPTLGWMCLRRLGLMHCLLSPSCRHWKQEQRQARRSPLQLLGSR